MLFEQTSTHLLAQRCTYVRQMVHAMAKDMIFDEELGGQRGIGIDLVDHLPGDAGDRIARSHRPGQIGFRRVGTGHVIKQND